MSTKVWTAFCPESVSSPPINTLSDLNKSWMAVPSAKNSGLESISKWISVEFSSKISFIFSAVRTGNVDFSITILGWAFKSDTNDSRESAAIYVSQKLCNAGATLEIYDPMVTKDFILKDISLYWNCNSEIIQDRIYLTRNNR